MFFKLLLYKFLNQKILLVNNASGLGDYLWGRYYYPLLKEQYPNYKFVLIGTKRWIDFAKFNDSDIFDLFISVPNPIKGMKFYKKLMLSLILFDVFVNISNFKNLTSCIRSKKKYTAIYEKTKFYDKNIYNFYKDIIHIPKNYKSNFKFTSVIQERNYVLLAIGGYAQGSLSESQVINIINHLITNTKYKIFLLGDAKDLSLYNAIFDKVLDSTRIINGINVFNSYNIPEIVSKSIFTITPNTSIYHFCKILNKKCICISTGEIHSIDLSSSDENFVYVVDNKLENMIKKGNYKEYTKDIDTPRISDISNEKIISAIKCFEE